MLFKLVTWVLLAILLAVAAKVLWFLDLNKRVYNHRPGKCQLVEGPVNGAEDIEYLESEGLAFITSGIFYMAPRPGVEGKIFLYDFNDPATKYKATELKIKNKPAKFQAHGITSWVENGKVFLYVVNHHQPEFTHSIEVFEFNKVDRSLTHLKTFKHENFIRDKFVFTNDGSAQTARMNLIEMLLGLKAGSIGYFDGQDVHWLLERDSSPNGLWVDLKKMVLFVASPNSECVKVYNLAKDFKSISFISQIDLLTSPDNLYMDKTGHLWTGAHPVMSKLSELESCNRKPRAGIERAPSQVLRIQFSADYKTAEVTEPYTDDGRQLCCSATAVHDGKGNLLIGSVAAELVHCEYTEHTI
ncbi:unnamed protein product, partial [Mesorhabditis spiculigera]